MLLQTHKWQVAFKPAADSRLPALLVPLVARGDRVMVGAWARTCPLSTLAYGIMCSSTSTSSKGQAFWRSRTCKLSSGGMADRFD